MPNEEKTLEFDSYNAMSRAATFFGIPIFPLLIGVMGTLFSLVAGFTVFGWPGLFLATPFIVGLIFLRIISETDSKYLRRLMFMINRFWLNRRYGRSLLLTSHNPSWSKFYGRRFAQQRVSR
jgi:type IV secretory pathway VirB3-like protein